LGITYLPFWAFLHTQVSRFSFGLLFGLVLPAGLGIAFLGVDLVFRACLGRAGEGWYLRRIGLRRRTPPVSGEDTSRFGSRPHEL